MANVASLNVVLSASTAKFSAGMAKGRAALGGFAAAVTSTKAAITGLGALLAGGLAVGGLTAMVKRTVDAIDEQKDLASQLGITTDALTRLNYAATLNGSSAEAVGSALGFMNKNLGEAAVKGGTVAEMLRSLNLDARQLAAQAPDKAFEEIADAISKLQNASLRAAAAQTIFGRGGKEVINLLALGRDGLRQYAAEADRLGVTLKQIDAEKVGAAKDALDRVGFVLTGLKNKLAVELAPFIEAAANKFAEMASAAGGFGNALVKGVEIGVTGIAHLIDLVDILRAGWHGLVGTILKANALAFKAANVMGQILNEFDILGKHHSEKGRFADVTPLINVLESEAKAQFDKMGALWNRDSSGNAKKLFDEIREGANKAADAAAKAKPKLDGIIPSPEGGGFDFLGKASAGLSGFLADLGGKMLEDAKRKFEGTKEIVEDIAEPLSFGAAPGAVSRNVVGQQRASSMALTPNLEKNTATVAKEAPKQTMKLDQLVAAVKDLAGFGLQVVNNF